MGVILRSYNASRCLRAIGSRFIGLGSSRRLGRVRFGASPCSSAQALTTLSQKHFSLALSTTV